MIIHKSITLESEVGDINVKITDGLVSVNERDLTEKEVSELLDLLTEAWTFIKGD